MAKKEFLQGEITERFLDSTDIEGLASTGARVGHLILTPTTTITVSLILSCFGCPMF